MCLGRKFSGTTNSAWQVWRNGQSENGAVFGRGTSLSLSLSLVARTFWHTFGLNLKGFFTHFIVVSSYLVANFSYFIVVLTHLFTYKRHFLGHCAFLKFLNALFLGFLRLSLRAVFAKTADFVILSVAKNPKNLRYALFMDTSLALSMTNSGFCLKITDIFTHILGTKFTNFIRFYGLPRSLCSLAMTARQKFKFFTQNSRHSINLIHFANSKHFTNSIHFINLTQNSKHFTNSTHFINLTQILSPTQGFFISLPQVFAQCKLIKNFLQGGHCV